MSALPLPYYEFWSNAFQLRLAELKTSRPAFVTAGRYIEKHHDQYVFFYQDLLNNKKILACSAKNMRVVQGIFGWELMLQSNLDTVRSTEPFNNMKLCFKDMDFALMDPSDFKPAATDQLQIRQLIGQDEVALDKFYGQCPVDDKDTLDFNLNQDVAMGLFADDELVGVARYVQVKLSQIADVTVLIKTDARGQGLSTPLVSELIKKILLDGLNPKYRVDENNQASIKVAQKLGLTATHRILTWQSLPLT